MPHFNSSLGEHGNIGNCSEKISLWAVQKLTEHMDVQAPMKKEEDFHVFI